MKLGDAPCRWLNSLFNRPPATWLLPTPALGERRDAAEYAAWEFQRAGAFFALFGPHLGVAGCSVLDVGCGVGGKSTYLAAQGARLVIGIDVDAERVSAARSFADGKSVPNVRFASHDACALPFSTDDFDIVFFNDAFEHLPDPLRALQECCRILRPGGRIGLVFPPYNSPWGAHLFTYVRIPWAQLLCRDEGLVRLWQSASGDSPSGGQLRTVRRQRAIRAATSVPDIMSLNQMTIRRFETILAQVPLRVVFRDLHVPGKLLGFLARMPKVREFFVTRVVAVLEKH